MDTVCKTIELSAASQATERMCLADPKMETFIGGISWMQRMHIQLMRIANPFERLSAIQRVVCLLLAVLTARRKSGLIKML